ncbi:MAG TPA: twin-arginine translocase subunit TatC [Candidatus Didemnitutus sp.]|nr:twin-arginine translocase subunit TatC [Candidatus Didemnitutus sp.]
MATTEPIESVEVLDDDKSMRKSFWGHLEDLRTALIRCAWVVGIALVVCLLFVNKIMWVLEYPLRHLQMFTQPPPTVALQIGSTKLGPFPVSREQFEGLPPGQSPQVVFQVGTKKIGTDQVVTLKMLPPPPEVDQSLVRLRNFGPAEAFFVAFKVALYASLVVAAPLWLYFLGQFILPALNVREKRFIRVWLGWGSFLFIAGVLATYFIMLPLALRASMQYSSLLGFQADEWRAEDYVSFCTNFMLGMGFGFQFPLVLLTLVKAGIINHRHLAKYRRHAIVVSLVLGAFLTTPEVITQLSMAVPMYLLYEICIWIAWYWEWKQRRVAKG